MGRKLTAVKVHKKSKLGRKCKKIAMRSHKGQVTKAFRNGFSTSIEREPLGIQQTMGNNLEKTPSGKFFIVCKDQE